jgi:hypothetical protein
MFYLTDPRCCRLRLEPLEDRRMLATITVDTLADGIGVPGTSLREAIAAAATGDTVAFSVTGAINLTQASGTLLISKNLFIDGPGANLLTINGGHGADGLPNTGDGFQVINIDNANVSTLVCRRAR